ncbi:MAG: LacI family transcriptional regulator, partial [Chitinophagaceae bacterium]|nr:LacI family transcriptional regulator [Chitinophagaceae bacterium]
NDFEGSLEATQYLINNGHKRIACIQGIAGTSTNSQRIDGYKRL